MKIQAQILLSLMLALGLLARHASAQNRGTPDGIATGYINAELPSWLRLGGEERVRVESLDGIGYRAAGNTYLLQRLRLSLDITPRSWLKVSFQLQDSRSLFTNVSPTPSSQKDPVDLRLGYLQFGRGEEGLLNLRVGRQSLDFGEGRLVADPKWSNVGRSFDAVRLTLHYKKLRLDAFTAASDKIYIDGFATPVAGEHFDGLYGSLDQLIPNSTIEPYMFWKMEHNVKGEINKSGNLDEKTAGLRWVGQLPLGLDYGMESAIERGTQASEPISAWATHVVLGETLPDTQHLPRFFVEFNRATGDRNSRDGIRGAFDPLFPASHDKFGVADQFCWTNILFGRVGFQYRARRGLTLSTAYSSFWLADRRDGIYSSGKVIIASNGGQGNHIGREADIQGRWNLGRFLLVDVAYGRIFPGEFLRHTGHTAAYNSLILGLTQRF